VDKSPFLKFMIQSKLLNLKIMLKILFQLFNHRLPKMN